jgi:hypothetical protein
MKSPFIAKAQRRKGDAIYFPKTLIGPAPIWGCGEKFIRSQNAFIEDNLPV